MKPIPQLRITLRDMQLRVQEVPVQEKKEAIFVCMRGRLDL